MTPSPLAGEGGARRAAVGGRGESGPIEPTTLLGRAQKMRREPTDAERRLWSLLRAKRMQSYKFHRQKPIDPYIVDFVCFSHRLIVEVDGSQHAENPYDERRDGYLRSQGFTLLRIWNNDVLQNPDAVLTKILSVLEAA